MKFENLCIKCMKEKSAPNTICEHCGFDASKVSVPPHHLEPCTILAGKYLVGMAIGEGGFGITYIGMDLNLEMRVAINEYYPHGCAIRDMRGNSCTVNSYEGGLQNYFETGREKFINEARVLARCDTLPEIVAVRDFFKENHTAYIVMEYIEGKTLKTYLKEKGGRISVSETLKMMEPVIRSLGQVHRMNLIHRDISPDNLMIRADGSIKVLDFGGARDFIEGGKSLSIMLKPGYAPEEQYRTHGEQGAWTDVYAICATMYRCITGITPPEAMERTYWDELKPFSAFQIACPKKVEYAIFKGLSVYRNARFQSMEELHRFLYETQTGNSQITSPPGTLKKSVPKTAQPCEKKTKISSNRHLKIIVVILACVLFLLTGMVTVFVWMDEKSGSTDLEKSAEALAEEIIEEAMNEEEGTEKEEKKDENKKMSFAGHHYQIFDDDKEIRWTDARRKCEEMGGHLVTITSPEEQQFVEELISKGENVFYWIGATDSGVQPNQYYWITGEAFNYNNWREGQPDNGDWGVGGTEDYIGMLRIDVPKYKGLAYSWNDFRDNPNDSHGYVCEWDE